MDVVTLEIEERDGRDELADEVDLPPHPGPVCDSIDERSTASEERERGLLGLDQRGLRTAGEETRP